jgi:hypothetical protein
MVHRGLLTLHGGDVILPSYKEHETENKKKRKVEKEKEEKEWRGVTGNCSSHSS